MLYSQMKKSFLEVFEYQFVVETIEFVVTRSLTLSVSYDIILCLESLPDADYHALFSAVRECRQCQLQSQQLYTQK